MIEETPRRITFSLFVAVFLILVIGIINLYSASRADASTTPPIYVKQLIWLGISLVAMGVTVIFDYRFFDRWAYLIYLLNISLLVLVLFLGDRTSGAVRWFTFGPISLQPSELMKISLILAMAHYVSNNVPSDGMRIRDVFVLSAFALVPVLLIVKEPDLGSAGLVVLIFATVLFSLVMRPGTTVALAISGILLVPSGIYFGWNFLKPYQRQRIVTFINPELDPLGAGYHSIQSKIAVGSGKIIGKGYLEGTQSQLRFLPEQHTDFIFSVLAEEWGLLGALVVLALLFVVIYRAISIARDSRNVFGSVVAIGISAVFFWQCFVNIGMAVGIFPVVGIPLPFLSYGGSSLLAMLVGVGLLFNLNIRRQVW